MSKRLKEVFAKMRYVSFLETIENDPCKESGTLDIIVEEQLEDGSSWSHEVIRYVKICHSQNQCKHYEVEIDKDSGIGKIRIDDISAVQQIVVQVDENGMQMLNDDAYHIQYFVNDGCCADDYATVYFTNDPSCQHQVVRIVNRKLPETRLEIYKILRDQKGNPVDFTGDQEFTIHMRSDGCFEKFITLNQENCFHETLCGLTPGFYTIEECECGAYATSYRLNFGDESCDTLFDLTQGHNELQIINEARSDTQLTIEKYIRKESGELCKPLRFEEFQIRVISNAFDRIITLNENNDYCVTLYGIEPGYYDISEVSQNAHEFDVTYSVNGRKEDCFANVEINECQRVSVAVINNYVMPRCCVQQDSPLRIRKYVRSCNGCIQKPDEHLQFMVMVSGCGMCETFYLNANNNFCVDIANLCQGEYEIREVSCGEYTTSYIVNDGMEKTSACVCINGCENYCVSIINEERNRGFLSVSKFIRNEFGDIVKPQKHKSFQITLSSYFYKECFTLNRDNDWCVCFHDLRFGSYEVREEGSCKYETTYQINCDKERRHARLFIDSCCENEVKIINSQRTKPCGILKICKYEETNSHELVKPASDEEFDVEVSGACFCERYTLRASNNWCIMLEGLHEGEYQVSEIEHCDYDVSYLVNQDEMEEAFVYMGEMNQEVTIINTRKQSGTLKLCATVRDCDGEFVRPQRNTTFEILVEGSNDSFTVCLDACNNWCVLLDQLCEDVYRIIQKDNLGYKVSYLVNNKESSFAKIQLGRSDEEILIINEESNCTGIVKVTKYMEDEQGNLYIPCPEDEFRFELCGRCFSRTYTLRSRNDFCVYFDDLEEGTYRIKELEAGYDTRYRINEQDVDEVQFQLSKEDIYVDIINSERRNGIVSVDKRIARNHTLVRPDVDACYRILLKGKHCHEIYELNADNDFCVCFENLENQHYEIKELDSDCHIYEVNGKRQEDGYFLYEGDSIAITVINEEILYGNMEIVKKIEDEEGNLIRPNRYECFDILVESDRYKEKFTLNHENDFCIRLYDLPQGHYEVKELGCHHYASYLINGQPCNAACVDVCDLDTCITVINRACARGCIQFSACVMENGKLREPLKGEEFKLVVASESCQETLCLQDCNDFCDQLCDLSFDAYTITECGEDAVRFEIDGHVFEDVVCIELNGEHVCVKVVRTKQDGPNITICKKIEDSFGHLHTPKEDAAFGITLLHNGRKQMFELNCDNAWTKVLKNQAMGAYEIKEVKGGDSVRYQIDQECPSANGYFEVKKSDVSIVVLNAMQTKGHVHLESSIKDCDGNIVTPQRDMVFYMHVQSCEMEQTIVLNSKNHWHQSLEVDAGSYTIEQNEDPAFKERYYLVDDNKECQVRIQVDDTDMHVQSVNVMKCAGGCIEVAKYKRDVSCGCFTRPKAEEEYEVEIKGNDFHKIITLNSCNHWKEKLDMLPYGPYELKEIGANQKVCYIINGEKEVAQALIDVQEQVQNIKIINEEISENKGSIEICKLLKDGEGCYRYPSQDDSFWVKIKGENTTSRVLLNYANRFYASIRNLREGWYEVSEESEINGIHYVVNNGAPVNRGLVQVKQNANTVNIINPCAVNGGSIEITKYLQSQEGLLMKPVYGEYRVHISKSCFNQVVVLNKENAYHVVLDQLEDGDYVVDELDHEDVCYVVDKGGCVDYGVVSVAGDTHQIKVINAQQSSQKGSITLAKYVRKHAQLMRPNSEDSYVFHVSKPGFNQFYTLDKSNQFMQVIDQLKDGDYRIAETTTTDDVSYIINGQHETMDGVVSVHANSNTVQIINTKRNRTGSISLQKFMRVNGELVTPPAGFVSNIHVTKPGYNEMFTLHERNRWTYVVTNLSSGVYVVDEVDDMSDISYVVDGGSEVHCAAVNVEQNEHKVAIINTIRAEKGTIQIAKFMRDGQQLVKPHPAFTAQVHVSKAGYNEIFLLNRENDWKVILRDLMDGSYVIDEVDNDMEVRYSINGGNEVANAVVNVNKNTNDVKMINTVQKARSEIKIAKFIRNDEDQLVHPDASQTFDIHVEGPKVHQIVRLDANNRWTKTLQDLTNGIYHIEEKGNTVYRVSYSTDGSIEQEEANIMVHDDMHTVNVINHPMRGAGILEIKKFIKQADGTLMRPADGDLYMIEVRGEQFSQQVELNFGNQFSAVLRNLKAGDYTVKEISTNNSYISTYRVNGIVQAETAMVTMAEGKTNVVEVLNELIENLNTIEVFKYMLDADGNYLPPVAGQIFQFRIIGNHVDYTYELNVDNSWHRSLKMLPSGAYQVMEIGSPFQVKYIVNSAELREEAKFIATAGKTNIIGIINILPGVDNGRLLLTKRIRTSGGQTVKPKDESFVLRVQSNTFHQLVTLNEDNNYTEALSYLPYGEYEVMETDARYPVYYQVNNGSESKEGKVNIINDDANEMVVINVQTDTSFGVSDNSTIKVIIE